MQAKTCAPHTFPASCSFAQVVLSTLERRFRQLSGFEAVFRISALQGEGLPELRKYLLDQASIQPHKDRMGVCVAIRNGD